MGQSLSALDLPFLELVHVQEPVAELPGQLELRRQGEHGLVEVPEYRLHSGRVLVAVVDVVVQTDELPARAGRQRGICHFTLFI